MQLAAKNPKKRGGRKKFKETRHPVFRGVRHRSPDKWVCETREPNKKSRIWLGTFPTAEMAARAHDVASIALRGTLACLNFADSVSRLPIPASGGTKDIQRAAAEAAELFRPLAPSEENDHNNNNNRGFWMDEDIFDLPEIVEETYNITILPPQDLYCDDEMLDCYLQYDAELPLWNF